MKTLLFFSITCAICLIGFNGFSQHNDPLKNDSRGIFKVKTKEEMAKNLEKLTERAGRNMKRLKTIIKKLKIQHLKSHQMKSQTGTRENY